MSSTSIRGILSSRTALVLLLLGLPGLIPIGPSAVHASTSANIVTNHSFEQGLLGWQLETCEGVANATDTVDSSRWVDGNQAAKVYVGPVTNTYCFSNISGTRNIGFVQFRQFLPTSTNFTILTDSPNGFSFWFSLQPYASGTMGGFEVRIFGAESIDELDYVFNPDPSLSYPNYTDPHTGEGLRSLLFYGYQPGQWYHFSRNLRADWGSLNLNLTRIFSLVQFEGLAIRNGQTVQSETFWLDDVRVYTGTEPLPPETHYAFFNFTDPNGNIVDNVVRWKLFNWTGQEVPYTLGENTLPTGPYFLETYYRAYGQNTRIVRDQVHLDMRLNIALALFPDNSVPGDYVALDNPATSVGVSRPDHAEKVTVQGTAGTAYSMILDIPVRPVLIQGNGVDFAEGYDWAYDSTLSVARIGFVMPSGGEIFTIFFQAPTRIPDLSFVDVTGSSLQGKITFQILDSQGTPVPYVVGRVLPPASFFVEAYYGGYGIYRKPVNTVGPFPITLTMLPLTASKDNYLALNSTATSIAPSEFSRSKITFEIQGRGPYLVVLSVPKRPLYVEKDGVRTASWVYNSSSQTIAIEAATQGSFQVVMEQTSSSGYVYLAGTAGLFAAAVLSGYLWKRKRSEEKASMP